MAIRMYSDRRDAGRRLAASLLPYDRPRPLVLGLPRGGIPVAAEVATALGGELDALVVRKVGAPGNPEYAIGAVGEDGVRVIDHQTCRSLRLSDEDVAGLVAAEQRELQRRIDLYRGGCRRLGLAGRNVVIVDDGLATGATAAAAVSVARHFGAQHVTVAVPVGSPEAVALVERMADAVICPLTPSDFRAVGQFYADFSQVADDDVVRMLHEHPRGPRRIADASLVDADVGIPVDGSTLAGRLTIPRSPHLLAVFAHGSGSDHRSPRNVAMAHALQAAGIGTLLVDLFTDRESPDAPFDLGQSVRRLSAACAWAGEQPEAASLPIGLHGSSTGGAVALAAAAMEPGMAQSIVTRSGRPDLAAEWLPRVSAPTLLIVGARDAQTLELNRQAQTHIGGRTLLEVVRGAGHLFDEPGTLQQAARLAQSWYLSHCEQIARVS